MFLGTANLMEYLKNFQPHCRTIVFSTDEVFGAAPEGVYYKEDDRFKPSNPYSAAKAGEEMIAFSFAHAFGMPVFTTRSMNIIGERQHPEKFLPKIIRSIQSGQKVMLHGRGPDDQSSRCWIHARNVADGVMFLLDRGKKEEFYHIVGEERTVLEIANWVSQAISGGDLPQERIEWVDYHTARPGHDKRYALDGSKMAAMGWKPPVDLEHSVKKTVEWTLKNPKWLNL
jgi:dTDP-D-glucose 4,6-dehydratase